MSGVLAAPVLSTMNLVPVIPTSINIHNCHLWESWGRGREESPTVFSQVEVSENFRLASESFRKGPSFSAVRQYQPFFRTRFPSVSAICTAFKAAPLRRLSLTHHRLMPFSTVES